jgi:hypothetical protein
MEAASTSETSVKFYQTTRRNNPEDSHLYLVVSFEESAIDCLRPWDTTEVYFFWQDDDTRNIITGYFTNQSSKTITLCNSNRTQYTKIRLTHTNTHNDINCIKLGHSFEQNNKIIFCNVDWRTVAITLSLWVCMYVCTTGEEGLKTLLKSVLFPARHYRCNGGWLRHSLLLLITRWGRRTSL